MTRLISQNELSRLNLTELRGMYRKTFNELVQSNPQSHERRNALASLENISREMACRHLGYQ